MKRRVLQDEDNKFGYVPPPNPIEVIEPNKGVTVLENGRSKPNPTKVTAMS
jgi:hypothetical protein